MRKSYLDNIRWMTVILVVIYHVFYMYNAEGLQGVCGKITDLEVQVFDVYQYAVYPWFMMLLFIVSGICARFDLDRHSEREFLRKRTVRYLVPSTIGLFAFHFIQGYVNMRLSNAFGTMTAEVPKPFIFLIMAVSGTGVLWYLQLLWLFSVLLLFLRRIEKDRLWEAGKKVTLPVLVLMTLVVWGSGQLLNTPIVTVYRFGLYGTVFVLGYCVFSHEEAMERVKKAFPLFLMFAAVTGIAFCVRYFGENYAVAPVNRTFLYAAFGWTACLTALGGMAEYGAHENGFTRFMSRHSFGLYVFHYLGISSVALWLAKPGILPAPAAYPASLAAGLAAGYLLEALISRIPFFRWAVLGISKGGRKTGSMTDGQ